MKISELIVEANVIQFSKFKKDKEAHDYNEPPSIDFTKAGAGTPIDLDEFDTLIKKLAPSTARNCLARIHKIYASLNNEGSFPADNPSPIYAINKILKNYRIPIVVNGLDLWDMYLMISRPAESRLQIVK